MVLFAHRVTGVGDEAFASPPGNVQYVIYARKGKNAISVSSFYSSAGEAIRPLLNEVQLKSNRADDLLALVRAVFAW